MAEHLSSSGSLAPAEPPFREYPPHKCPPYDACLNCVHDQANYAGFQEGAAVAFGLMGMFEAISYRESERDYDPLVCIHGRFHREVCDECEALENQEPFV